MSGELPKLFTEQTSPRRPYRGACHCGNVQYIVFLRLPYQPVPDDAPPLPDGKDWQNVYRCNCTTCHKTGMFHVRLSWAPEDFVVLAPEDPDKDMGTYQCNDKMLRFKFCKTCSVMCFVMAGEGEHAELNLDELGIKGKDREGLGTKTIWRPKAEGWNEREYKTYLSVNGYTIEQRQDGFDLRDMTEQKVVQYVDCLDWKEKVRYDRPHAGGAY